MIAHGGVPTDAAALVLTHRRPRLCTRLVRHLVEVEGFPPERVVVVVNGQGGLSDEALARAVDVLRLPSNQGPAGGFKVGMEHVLSSLQCRWVYVCEDDLPIEHMNAPRVAGLVEDMDRLSSSGPPIGAATAWGRRQDPRTGASVAHEVAPGMRYEDIDVAGWGATLLSTAVAKAGILPDERLFFGYEDWDFLIRLRRAGFRLVIDNQALKSDVYGRRRAFIRSQELHAVTWRGYYDVRNYMLVARRYGDWRWVKEHLRTVARLLRRARTWRRRVAIVAGLIDGARGKAGLNARYVRPAVEDQVSDERAPASPTSQDGRRAMPQLARGPQRQS